MATGNNGQGLRLGGGQGLVIDGIRASNVGVISGNDTYLPDLHTLDSNPYAQLVANGDGEFLTGQDYWNQARNRADSALTARYQDYYTKEAAQINAQRQADAAQTTTAQNQREAENRTSWREVEAQARSGVLTSGQGIASDAEIAALIAQGPATYNRGMLGAAQNRALNPTGMSRAVERWDTAIGSVPDAIQTFAVDARIPFVSPALYMAAGVLPQSTGELALGVAFAPAGRLLGAGYQALNRAAAGTFLTADLGAATGRALHEVGEFAAERLGRLNEGLGYQPALIENTGLRATSSETSLFKLGTAFENNGVFAASGQAFEQNQMVRRLSVRAFDENGILLPGRTVLDAAGTRLDTGVFGALEFKLSPNAPLTLRQSQHFPNLDKYGGVVVGNNGRVIGLQPGTVLQPFNPNRINGPALPGPGNWWNSQ